MPGAEPANGDGQPVPASSKRKRTRWGNETEAGLAVLAQPEPDTGAGVASPSGTAQGWEATPGADQQLEGSADAGPRRRRSRWEPQDDALQLAPLTAVIPGLPGAITLPPSLAALIDLNPETLQLQMELNNVRWASPGSACDCAQLLSAPP